MTYDHKTGRFIIDLDTDTLEEINEGFKRVNMGSRFAEMPDGTVRAVQNRDYTRAQEKEDDTKKYDAKMNMTITCGFLVPIGTIKHRVEEFCWKEGLTCKFLQSGFLVRELTIMVESKNRTKREHYQIKAALDDYFRKISNC